jgi:hypothetical protein
MRSFLNARHFIFHHRAALKWCPFWNYYLTFLDHGLLSVAMASDVEDNHIDTDRPGGPG